MFLRGLVWAILMVVALLCDNFSVQVTSMILPSVDAPLRDPYHTALESGCAVTLLKSLARLVNVEQLVLPWILLLLCCGHPAHRILLRAFKTQTFARSLRTLTYLLVILPPPKNCRRLLALDFFSLSYGSMCGNLLYSGHGTWYALYFLSLATLAAQRLQSRVHIAAVTLLLGFWVILKFVETVSSFDHYSVDMLVSFYVTALIWLALGKFHGKKNDRPSPAAVASESV